MPLRGLLKVLILGLALGTGWPASAGAAGGSAPEGPFAQDFSPLEPPVPAPQEAFQDLAGEAVRLADFAGGAVLLNFWATWCPPCIHEMPSLDRLQAALEPEGLTVIAVSIDRGGQKTVAPFLKRLGLEHVSIYLDPKSKLARAFGISGLPVTYLIDAEGRVLRSLTGPAEWDSEEAVALIRHHLKEGGKTDRQSAAARD